MMKDSSLKLALSLHSAPGVYALVLGSGVSRSAGIPTGWEIVLDIVGKLARLAGEKVEPDPESWYRAKFRRPLDYSRLLKQIASTPSERNALLRSYFEPNEEERDQGLKLPTSAHRAIASLVKDGYIKMILTTNFDRLLESALEEQGVTPDVISTDDALAGALPFVHSQCTVIKLHGDYRDMRIRNTADELAKYSSGLNTYLDRILDEFGLIVCGWSGEWDSALRDAILRCPTRRFTTYWTSIGESKEDANRIIAHRRAEVIQIKSGDSFFSDILEKVLSLKDLEAPHPISTAVAVATTKRYLTEERHRIRLHDLISDELEEACTGLSGDRFDTHAQKTDKEQFQARMHEYEVISDRIIGMTAAIAYFDPGVNAHMLTRCIERLAETPRTDGLVILVGLQRYPALLTAYAAGLSSIASQHYAQLAAVLMAPKIQERGKRCLAVEYLNVWEVFDQNTYKLVPRPDAQREYTPANMYIGDLLRDHLKSYLPSDQVYQNTFDIFEYLLGLTYIDLIEESGPQPWGPWGNFVWRYRDDGIDGLTSPIDEFLAAGILQRESWGLLKAGFFRGSVERLESVRERFEQFLTKVRRG